MRKLLIIIVMAICGFCHAQTASELTIPQAKNILESFCLNYYNSCFEGKDYIPQSIIIKSVGIDANNGVHTLVVSTLTKDNTFHSWVEKLIMTYNLGLLY